MTNLKTIAIKKKSIRGIKVKLQEKNKIISDNDTDQKN